jgi:hypothetical protein
MPIRSIWGSGGELLSLTYALVKAQWFNARADRSVQF